ncbi:MAG: DMT family transporter [Proteobacteria bacterium]|nr:DMT family transporter [Pseudomonadota bacterium]MBU4583472.1 DMT family transporter [Pseudomonadota bacterium]MCG2740139.1 DMT family transporter [Syntrophaceae bacterium]
MEVTREKLIKGLIFSLIAAISISLLPILYKLGYRAGMDELGLLQNRWFFGAVMLFAYILVTDRHSLMVNGATLVKTAILGAFFHGLSGIFFLKALRYIPASTTSLIIYFYPVVVTIYASLFFHMRMSRAVIVSLGLTVFGCSLVFCDAFIQELNGKGILYAATAMIIYSAYLIVAQLFLRGEKPLIMTFYMALFSGVTFSFFHNPLKILELQQNQLLIGLFLGLIPTAFAYAFNFRAIREVGSGYVSIFSTFELVMVVCLSFLVLGEPIFIIQIVGMFLIISGIVLANAKIFRKGGTMGNWR